MAIFLNTILRHALSVSTLMFVVLPFVSTMTQGTMIPGNLSAGLPSFSGFQSSLNSVVHSGARAFVGGASGLYLGGAHPIFLN